MNNKEVRRLLLIGNLSIFMIGLGFAVRTAISGSLQTDIYSVLDLANSAGRVGQALGYTFLGFAFTLLFGSALVDWVGAKKMLLFSAASYLLGSLAILIASIIPVTPMVDTLVVTGLMLTGLGWGAVEAASNPMVASLDPENKVHRLNVLHAWWPAGIVVGGLAGLLFTKLGIAWQFNLVLLVIPSLVMAFLVLKTDFPQTERVVQGVSYGEMFAELVKQPMFYVFWACMWLTATAELAPGSWVEITLTHIIGMSGIVILVYVSMLMFVMRHFAGALAHKFSAVGVLWVGSLLAAVGLYLLSIANSPVTAFAAATIWAIGVCYLWPTMLACVSERFPRGGALLMGLMGFGGGMAIWFALPKMGAIFDQAKLELAGGEVQFAALTGDALAQVLRAASVESFQAVAVVPLILLPVFGAIWLYDRSKKKA
jgi:hypothetical protein